MSRPRRTANDVRRTHSLNARILSRKRSFDCPFWTKPRNFAPRANDSAIVGLSGGNPTSPGKTAPPPGPAGHGDVSLYRGLPPSGLGAGARRAGRAESWDTQASCAHLSWRPAVPFWACSEPTPASFLRKSFRLGGLRQPLYVQTTTHLVHHLHRHPPPALRRTSADYRNSLACYSAILAEATVRCAYRRPGHIRTRA